MYKSPTTLLNEVRFPPKGLKMKATTRKAASKVVFEILKPTWFDSIPMKDIMDGLKKVGVVVLQEDNMEWSGMLMGSNAHSLFTLGDLSTAANHGYGMMYEPFVNAGLLLTWYRSDARRSLRTEVIGYIS